jgi:hypothetical protein
MDGNSLACRCRYTEPMKSHAVLTIAAALLTGCATGPNLYAGGDGGSVYITDQQAEVASCRPIENIRLADQHREYGQDNQLQFQLRVARLGGNTGLVISGTLDRPLEGVAFKC